MYFDSAYSAESCVTEADSHAVRSLVRQNVSLVSSQWCVAELSCVFHRHAREGRLTPIQAPALTLRFLAHVDAGFWKLVPVTDALLRRVSLVVSAAPRSLFLRAADALHLITAQDLGEPEIWSNDRHLLAAAPHFGLAGRSV